MSTATGAPTAPPPPSGPSAPPAAPASGSGSAPGGRFVARAAAATAVLTAAGSFFGLVRDQTIAHLFGAGSDTDAFLVSWTIPEFASTILIEDAMALVLVPAFSLALSRRAASRTAGKPGSGTLAEDPAGNAADPVRALLAATLPRLLLALACAAAAVALLAPLLVGALAPGLADPGLAVDCTRLTAVTVLGFGTAGYFSAALRAHRSFVPPAAIYCAYNIAIVAVVLGLHARWGVRAAAFGVAAGSLAMVLVQLPAFWRRLPVRTVRARRAVRGRRTARAPRAAALVGWGLVAPVAVFALSRQSQVLVERFLASGLPPGAISHLNYAQKIAQLPMTFSLLLCTVTFPLVARAMADGRTERARRRVERDLVLAATVVLLGAAYVIAYAPQIVQLLFERGAFDAGDTAATASVMRVYATGLLGHCLAGALVRPFFAAARPVWYPAGAMAVGLLLTVAAGALAAPRWGVHGIAAANAAGITTTALLLLCGLRTRVLPVRVRAVAAGLGRLALAAAAATAAGLAAAPLLPSPLPTALAGALVVPAAFTAAALAVRAPEVPQLLTAVTRRFRHVR
ncbi:lipid II flippase MurJ [Streptomyces radiopugnans]|uniref:Putative peptidoglycan lipid II flippase n=1 Tax=Streptomyces radiopugnans TaxID=403935 RepID=A0A1H9AXW1_9ACTN|nr:lipid II flippase MurJ [Streptomyces radiopugnans]SEP81327.1 putative peptidoglycan lipid II flippase [Streptomyces radiopugnans]